MINIIYTPQRNDYKAEYTVNNDILTVKINDIIETFDFTGLEEGMAEEIIAEVLPINPIINAEKIGDTVNITVIRFYSENEKEVFEIG
ncbi:MAG TPA: hypothetical protein VFC79_11870 [Tissierellaceae bacterium]|nr:hypothetical protein [Tissierellaceae bacterium]